MLPKSEAYKWHLIAMLYRMYRIWARHGGEDISRWMASLKRVWVANELKKSAEQAAYDIALDGESVATDSDTVNITFMDYLEKGFEKVSHEILRKNSGLLQFPCA